MSYTIQFSKIKMNLWSCSCELHSEPWSEKKITQLWQHGKSEVFPNFMFFVQNYCSATWCCYKKHADILASHSKLAYLLCACCHMSPWLHFVNMVVMLLFPVKTKVTCSAVIKSLCACFVNRREARWKTSIMPTEASSQSAQRQSVWHKKNVSAIR